MKQEMRAQDQVIIKLTMNIEQIVQEKDSLIAELAKTKRVTQLTKEELSQARLAQSLSLEEQLKQNRGVLGRLGRGSQRGITGQVDMQSRFMDFNKLKRKYEIRMNERGSEALSEDL